MTNCSFNQIDHTTVVRLCLSIVLTRSNKINNPIDPEILFTSRETSELISPVSEKENNYLNKEMPRKVQYHASTCVHNISQSENQATRKPVNQSVLHFTTIIYKPRNPQPTCSESLQVSFSITGSLLSTSVHQRKTRQIVTTTSFRF